MIADKALVVLSGGQDSSTSLFWAKKHFKEVYAISFSYGQKHVLELELAESLCKTENVPFKKIDLSFISSLASNSLTDSSIHMDEEVPDKALPNTFVPGRNLFFLSVAAVHARELGIKDIITGVSQTDFSGYPDCRDNFIKSINISLNLAMDYEFYIHTPLMRLDKEQTWALADELGVLDIIRYKTLTCYNGIIGDGCGHCPACKLRKRGLDRYLEHRK